MKYSLLKQLYDKRILAEILQNRFCSFDKSIVNWTYNDKNIKAIDLEEKLIRNYSNKVENKMVGNKIDYTDWLDIFDKSIKKLNSSNRQPILFFSGGKDSTFIASRMIKNKMKPLFYSYVNNNNHKKIILDLAEKLDIKIHFTNQDLKYLNFEDVYKQIKEPVLDPAGLSILLLLDINFKNKINFTDSVFIDGMGNDAYMGHLPGKRELLKMNLQKLLTKFNTHKIIKINFLNKLGKVSDLFRPDYMAHFPGSNIKLSNYYNQVNFYKKYKIYKDIVLQRALQRGIHYDFCCAINKSILYSNACDENSQIFFPFLDEDLIDHYEKRSFIDYNLPKLINKLSIRKYLDDELNFKKISTNKGIFHPFFPKIEFDSKQINLSKKIKVNIYQLNKFQKYDFFLWSKYLINNDINFELADIL
ncbi:MAG: hypothetical protein CMG49_01885 [Candidatus Marinimicrobia bacterium]|nr:hypothetical protein [Candidatus Neomarinimicrobiota bacterium]